MQCAIQDAKIQNTKQQLSALNEKKIVQKNRMQLSANFKKNIIYSIISSFGSSALLLNALYIISSAERNNDYLHDRLSSSKIPRCPRGRILSCHPVHQSLNRWAFSLSNNWLYRWQKLSQSSCTFEQRKEQLRQQPLQKHAQLKTRISKDMENNGEFSSRDPCNTNKRSRRASLSVNNYIRFLINQITCF